MSSMLKKKSGFKPKAPIRRHAGASNSPASGAALPIDRASTTPSTPAPSTTTGDKSRAPVVNSEAAIGSVDSQEDVPAASTTSETSNVLKAAIKDVQLENASIINSQSLPRSEEQAREERGPLINVNPSLEEDPSRTPRSIADVQSPAEIPSTSRRGQATFTPSQPTAVGVPPAISVSDPPISMPITPTTPKPTLPSVETAEEIDSRVTTRQAATVAARLTAHNQTPSLTPGTERLSTPLANGSQLVALRAQPVQAATPPAESGDATGESTSTTPSASRPAKRPQKRKTTDGATSQPKKRPRKMLGGNGTNEASKKPTKPKEQAHTAEDGQLSGTSGNHSPEADNDGIDEEYRKHRGETPEDAEDQKIDITKVKMAELARDLRIGKKFSLHDQLVRQEKELRQQYIEARRKRISGSTQPEHDVFDTREDGTPVPNLEKSRPGQEAESRENSTTAENLTAVGPQFQIVDGQIVLDVNSLQVDRHARAAEDAGSHEVVEENDFTRKVTSATYLRRKRRPQQWTDEETDEFYRLLRMFGTDFETISRMIPGKDRSNVIGKFRREDKAHPRRITEALTGPKTSAINIEEYERLAGEKLETTEAIIAEQKAAEEQFEAEEKRREEEAAEEARRKREALYGKDEIDGQKENNDESALVGKAKGVKGRKSKARTGGMGMP